MNHCAEHQASTPLTALIIGAGFAGIGMAIALRQAGITDFVILEKTHEVGGVWRDNSYPGAACDVPSHLYSFSFEPNPNWSRVFPSQAEIFSYLQHCAEKYQLTSHLQFGAEVKQAQYNELDSSWQVTLRDGSVLHSFLLISATGQLSQPALPHLEGIETFQGHSFHSAHWDHSYPLAGKRVAVIGTGASAIQFVPAIANEVKQLKLFQRSAAYLKQRPNRTYSKWQKTLFKKFPGLMKLHRGWIYLRYESQLLAFTKCPSLMKLAVARPFQKMLNTEITDPKLRSQLTPDYPIGCKRILLSNDYLAALNQDPVELVTHSIRRVTAEGIEATDGSHHPVDAIIYGTGFTATEFLAPMWITGRAGVELNEAWQQGAQAYLGMSVPNFPNFFMLYGPNTNLAHNSIIYMLESQIAHVVRCYQAMQKKQTTAVEVDPTHYRRFNSKLQQRLATSVWAGCKSWYVDDTGHNSSLWPSFTFAYRWRTRFSGLAAYRYTQVLPGPVGQAGGVIVAEANSRREKLRAAVLRSQLRYGFRPFMGPPFAATTQRRFTNLLSLLSPGVSAQSQRQITANGVVTQLITPDKISSAGIILYLHGGAFCLGSAKTHHEITSRLAVESGMQVWVPEYRLAPEHPYPAGLNDVLACYAALREDYPAEQIVIAGDSAGGALALSLALSVRDQNKPVAAGLMLLSPVTDATFSGNTLVTKQNEDPMIRLGWLTQVLDWYQPDLTAAHHRPLEVDLAGLPPMLVQVGEQELLLADSTRLAEHAARCGVPCRLEIYTARWHVFHLQAFVLQSARQALRTLASFAQQQIAAQADHAQTHSSQPNDAQP